MRSPELLTDQKIFATLFIRPELATLHRIILLLANLLVLKKDWKCHKNNESKFCILRYFGIKETSFQLMPEHDRILVTNRT